MQLSSVTAGSGAAETTFIQTDFEPVVDNAVKPPEQGFKLNQGTQSLSSPPTDVPSILLGTNLDTFVPLAPEPFLTSEIETREGKVARETDPSIHSSAGSTIGSVAAYIINPLSSLIGRSLEDLLSRWISRVDPDPAEESNHTIHGSGMSVYSEPSLQVITWSLSILDARSGLGNGAVEIEVPRLIESFVLTDAGTSSVMNDPPQFTVSAVSDNDGSANSVIEGSAFGTAVGITALATDGDASDTVTYSLTDDAGGRFAIDANSGIVTVANGTLLDYETSTSQDITVLVTSTDGSTAFENFTINLVDDTSEFSISAVSDSDGSADSILAGRIDIANYSETDQGFAVAARRIDGDGDLINATPADIYQDSNGLGVVGSTGSGAPANQIGYNPTFGISEELIFDFDNSVVDATVTVTALFASEGPSGEEGHWEAFEDGVIVGQSDFHTTSGSSMAFTIDLGSGATFDRLVFTANEYIGGQGGITSNSSDYFVQSIDYNYSLFGTVSEYALNGATVGITALATDGDTSDTVTYSLTDDAGGRFAIDANSGIITVANNSLLDFETSTSHNVSVRATSSDGSTSLQGFVVNLNDAIEGGPGSDSLTGTSGDDVIVGFGSSDTLTAIGGNDILIWDALDAAIDGGTGTDTLRVDSGDVDLTVFGGSITGLEKIDMEAGSGPNRLTLTAQDVLDLSDSDTLTVLGDTADNADVGAGWTDAGMAGGFHTFTQVIGFDTATLIIDTDMTISVS